MKWRSEKIPGIALASVIVVAGLLYYQYSWMQHSHRLMEEIFSQKVSMALCSAIESCNGSSTCTATCASSETSGCVLNDAEKLMADTYFTQTLTQKLAFYHLPTDYKIYSGEEGDFDGSSYPVCVVNLADNDDGDGMLAISFDQKDQYFQANLGWIPLVTLGILLFTICVLLTANWLLLRQKKLLRTNVDFFNNIAHEFNTPLTNIGLATNMLRKKYRQLNDDPLVDVVRKESAALLDQTSHILDLARVENEGFFIEKVPVPLQSLVHKAVAEMKMLADQHRASIHVKEIPVDVEVLADPYHMKNVLKNLLDNAIKYGGNTPEIKIQSQIEEDGILISVTDNGVGFPQGESRKIFERFHRIQENSTNKKGFGLGLSYVRKIMEMHQGSVRAFSEPNKGSRFILHLPNPIQ